MKRNTKINQNDPNFFPHNHRWSVYQWNQKYFAYLLFCITYGTKHGQKYTKSRLHGKEMFNIRMRQKTLYERTHYTFTKWPRCRIGKNWPMMYIWIVKNAIDVAVGFWVLGLIRNNIFLDKAYELSTYLPKIYWSNNRKS
jgi:hypothetical protein